MIKSIFVLIILYYSGKYIINHLKTLKADYNEENDTNFWMFTYDFKHKKKDSIFDKPTQIEIKQRYEKNKLILILYAIVILGFYFLNSFISQMLIYILNY